MSLSNLLEEMKVLAKAEPLPDDPDGDQDDADIRTAAGVANADNASQEVGSDEEESDEGEEGDESEQTDGDLAKSFTVKRNDGTETEVFDASDLIKSLGDDVQSLRAETVSVMQQALELIKSQAAEVASLKRQVESFGASGRGRKAVVSVTDKVAHADVMKKSASADEGGLSKQEFFAKAAAAQSAGRITAADVSVAEAYLNKGMPIPPRIVARVVGG